MAPPRIQVVAYDGSALSELALRRAVQVAEHADIAVVHAVCVARASGSKVILPTGERLGTWPALELLRMTMKELLRSWSLDVRSLKLVAHVRTGDAAQSVVDMAHDIHADRIVLGARGRHRGLHHVGSVASRIIALADVPLYLETGSKLKEELEPFDATRFAILLGSAFPRTRLGQDAPPPLSS